jgi:hypothetical protein
MLALSPRDAPLRLLTPPLHSYTYISTALHPLSSLSPRLPTAVFSFPFPRGHLRASSFSRRPHRAGPPFQRGLHRTPPLPLLLQLPSLLSSRPPQFTHAARRCHRTIRMPARAWARLASPPFVRTQCSPTAPQTSFTRHRIALTSQTNCTSYQPHALPRLQTQPPALNYGIALDQAKAEPPSIITLAVMRCTDSSVDNRKELAPTIVPGVHP